MCFVVYQENTSLNAVTCCQYFMCFVVYQEYTSLNVVTLLSILYVFCCLSREHQFKCCNLLSILYVFCCLSREHQFKCCNLLSTHDDVFCCFLFIIKAIYINVFTVESVVMCCQHMMYFVVCSPVY